MNETMKRYLIYVRSQLPLIISVLLVAAAFAFCWRFVDPAPPKEITIAAGQPDSGYYWWAKKYAEQLAKQGITTHIVTSNGAVDNLKLMLDPNSHVDAAFIQGGTVTAANLDPETTPLRSLAAIYYEPLWLFHRSNLPLNSLRELKGKRIAIGRDGSGTNQLATELLKWNGITPQNSTLIATSDEEAEKLLDNKSIDAAFLVGASGVPAIKRLIANPGTTTHSFNDAAAYVRRYDCLDAVTLPAGVINMEKNLPAQDITLLAPVATLIARENIHSAIVGQLMTAATVLHHRHNILSNSIDFPAAKNTELLMNKDAARYLQSGPPSCNAICPITSPPSSTAPRLCCCRC
jgi:TRAP transporter TAXI family solute receptor